MRKLTQPEINWKALPFIRLTLPLMLGIYLAEKIGIHHYSLNLLLLLFLFYLPRRLNTYTKRWISGVLVNVFLFLVGYQLAYYNNSLNYQQHLQEQVQEENYIIGTVGNLPSEKNGKIKLELHTQSIGTNNDDLAECSGKLLVYLKKYEGAAMVNYGDQLLIKSKIYSVPEPQNPNGFNYKQYLKFQNIHFQAFPYQKNWKIIANNQGNLFWKLIHQTRKHFLGVLKKYIQSEEEVAIASALILGYKNNLTQELKSAYSETGAIHVLAVSGLHVGIISGFLFYLLNLFTFKKRSWRWVKLGLILAGIWFFALLTGFSASVLRASILFTFLHFGYQIQRDTNTYNCLGIAAFLILLFNPYSLFDVGFQFSFLAVIGILFFTKRFAQYWLPNNKFLYKGYQLILVSFSAQLAIFPLMLYYFHQVPTYFWLSGLFAIPLAWCIMNIGVILILVSSISSSIASFLGLVLYYLIAGQNLLIGFVQKLPFHISSGFWVNQLEVVLLYGVIFSFAMLLLTYRKWGIPLLASCVTLVSCMQLSKDYSQFKQKKIVIYSVSKTSIVDFIDGNTVYALFNEELTKNQQTYTTQNNRWAEGTNKAIPINEEEFKEQNLYKKGRVIQFYETRVVIIKEDLTPSKKIDKPLACDLILVQDNPKIDFTTLKNQFSFTEVIFDGSNTSWNIKKWKIQCEALGILYTDVKKDGAYVLNLKKENPTLEVEEEIIIKDPINPNATVFEKQKESMGAN